ncbi:MAG: NAD(P)H-dependent oxidoreductase [Candidatus Bathyarchaeota archaeon]|nr:MAG: NAD(P)H-dependent oxidoreductase [Candidatus Bathyarchaeota archaeon]
MPSILIVYDSKTGNTEKMAYAIAEGVKRVEQIGVEVKRVTDTSLDDLLQANGIIVGTPTYYGDVSAPMKKLFDESAEIHGKLEGRIGAAFTSSGGVASGAETTLLSLLQAMLIHGMIIQGRSQTEHYGAAAVGSPDENEVKSCRDLGEKTAHLLLRFKPVH